MDKVKINFCTVYESTGKPYCTEFISSTFESLVTSVTFLHPLRRHHIVLERVDGPRGRLRAFGAKAQSRGITVDDM